jgi:hypothetical protein
MSKKSKSNPKTTVSPLMKTLATYMANAAKKPLPKHVAEKTKHHVLDTIAAMVSGSRLLPGTKAIAYAKTLGGAPQSLVIGSKIITNAEQAAHINGMLAHADETDDSHAASLSHPGCAIVPAALAMGEREKSNGTQLLRAVALGYDLCARLNLSLHRPATQRTVSARASVPLRPPRCSPDWITTACAMRCRTPRSSVRGFRAGCAMKNTSKKPSTSAACRRATA